ncbi:hypothetical protein [Winogradskyella sp. R77965]|uniref:DUF7486 family protein n=1 Tax=Winogradskyella sp. R77965 TaxID=3093872 RepID=UPI0037DC0C66
MKALKQLLKPSNFISLLFIILLGFSLGNAQTLDDETSNPDKPETELPPDIYWDVKAYLPQALLLRVKGVDKRGNLYDVKAIQNSDDTSVLDVKVLINGEKLPLKLIVKGNDKYYPLKGIFDDGTLLDIKAINDDGDFIDVKGISKSGNVVNIQAVTKDDQFYNIIAISPKGKVNSVKGIKMNNSTVETIINGVKIHAHVKSLKQD